MKLRLAGALLGLLMALPAFSQSYTAVTSTNMKVDNGTGTAINPPAGSQLCFQGTNTAGAAITYTPAGGSPVSSPVCQTFNSGGGLTASLQVANGATASPAGLLYTITITNGATTYMTLTKVSVTGLLFQIDQYSIPGNGTVSGIGYPHISCNTGAQWTSTTITPGGSTCTLIAGVGTWTAYPQSPYCPAGQGYIVPQVTGAAFCIAPQMQGLGAPAGACVNKSVYFQQDASTGQFLWGCVNEAWQQITGGGGGGGLTSFQGRTTAAATLQASDVQNILANAPFGFSGSLGLAYDSASGTIEPSSAWKFDGASNLGGTQNLYLGASPFSAPVISLNATTGAVSAANGSFSVSSAGATAFGGGSAIASSDNICQTSGTHCPASASVYYQVVQNNGASLTPRLRLAFAPSTGIQAVDNSGNNSSDVSLIQASSTQFGAVKCDGSTITCTSGVITAVASTTAITALTGDGTATGPGSAAFTLKTVNGAPGTCGDATHVCQTTTNGKGLTTSQAAVGISFPATLSVQTAGTPNSSQTVLNHIASTANATGLTLTPSNPSGGNEKYEATGTVNPTSGGTGINTSASTGVAQVSGGAWNVSTALNGVSVNGVTLQTGGSTTAFLNQAGGYSSASGNSVQIKYMSVEGCPQNSDPNAGGGTDATSCVNALYAGVTKNTSIVVVQDKGFSLISSNGILCPFYGNCGLEGEGGGIAKTFITNCVIAGSTAIFTALNNLQAGETGTLSQLTTCSALNNKTVTVLSAGLSSSQFEATVSASAASGAESAGLFTQAYGTGFFLAAGSRDLFSNGPWGSGTNCDIGAQTPGAMGSNILIENLVLNGNAPNQTNYCFGVDLNNMSNITIRDVVFYNASKYSLKIGNVTNVVLDGNKYFSTTAPVGTNTDGVHIEGPASDIHISNSYFHTSDDGIAVNAIEGPCGPIARVTITGNTYDKAYTAMRMYNRNLNACSNGLVPLISNVDFVGNNGTVAAHPFEFGVGTTAAGTLYPAISHVHISDGTFNSPASGGSNWTFNLEDNFDDLTISNFTIDGPTKTPLIKIGNDQNCTSSYTGQFGRLQINNLTVVNTAAGSTFSNLVNFSPCTTGGSISVHGFGTMWEGVTPTLQGPLIPDIFSNTSVSFNSLTMSDIDTTHLYIDDGHYASWVPSLVPSVMIFAPGGLMTNSIQTYGSATPTNTGSFSGMIGTLGGGVSAASNCNFSSVIAPTGCISVYYNGAAHYIPLK